MDELINLIKSHPDQINALAAVCALFVSLLSIILTLRTLRLQRIHNFKSLTPIANILTADYENELRVTIRNTGVGPLIVERFTASDGVQEKDNIVCLMPPLPEGIYWATFSPNIEGRCIPPTQDLVIIKLSGDPGDGTFASFRDEVRLALSKLTVTLEYQDIYDRRMPPKHTDLKWFARNLAAHSAP
ncbi:MAG: hypothetical protein M3416_04855 [Acidobacteriota bacterium]|nr:hypothetical protein [Acidobacteriota bacterium]